MVHIYSSVLPCLINAKKMPLVRRDILLKVQEKHCVSVLHAAWPKKKSKF